jgi:hypothetical protein
MIPTGRWAWWNQHSSLPLGECVNRAQQVEGVITKALFWIEMDAFIRAGIPVGVERYTYPSQPLREAAFLAEGVNRGAKFVVINAEKEWERAGAAGGSAMIKLLVELDRLLEGDATSGDVQVFASVDTRGDRMQMPYQQVLDKWVAGWMPMIYPKAFFPKPRPGTDWINQAFVDSLETGQDFQGKPVLPTLQTYDQIGSINVRRQLEDATRRGLVDVQAYTVGHATDPEWSAFVEGQQEDDDVFWMKDKILGFDGQPKMFTVMNANEPGGQHERSLTHHEWLQMSEFDFILPSHRSHGHQGSATRQHIHPIGIDAKTGIAEPVD